MVTWYILKCAIEIIDWIITPIEMLLDTSFCCWSLDLAVILLILLAII